MNYQKSGYPFLRYYDIQRQDLILNTLLANGYKFSQQYFFSENFKDWFGVENRNQLNQLIYTKCNPYTPNIIWGLTIQL